MNEATGEPEAFLHGQEAVFRYWLDNGTSCEVRWTNGWKLTGARVDACYRNAVRNRDVHRLDDLTKLAAWCRARAISQEPQDIDGTRQAMKNWFRGKGEGADLEVDGTIRLADGTRLRRDGADEAWTIRARPGSETPPERCPNARSAAVAALLRTRSEKSAKREAARRDNAQQTNQTATQSGKERNAI